MKAVEFPKDHLHPHNGRGYAYVEFSNPDEAENAMKHMDGGKPLLTFFCVCYFLFSYCINSGRYGKASAS